MAQLPCPVHKLDMHGGRHVSAFHLKFSASSCQLLHGGSSLTWPLCVPGRQLFTLACFIFLLALVGAFYPYNRGSLFTALIVLYALTAGVSGFVACSYFRQMEGGSWVRCVLATSFVFCGPLFLVFCFNNTVAIVYRVSAWQS